MESPSLVVFSETEEAWPVFRDLWLASAVQGAKVHDARIASLCTQAGVRELWTADRDFSRFPALKTHNPMLSEG